MCSIKRKTHSTNFHEYYSRIKYVVIMLSGDGDEHEAWTK